MNVSERFVLEQHKNTSFLPTSNTLPSESQIISTDKTNILIRSLLLRRQRHTGWINDAVHLHIHLQQRCLHQPMTVFL